LARSVSADNGKVPLGPNLNGCLHRQAA
jgi:hypothetical protein